MLYFHIKISTGASDPL